MLQLAVPRRYGHWSHAPAPPPTITWQVLEEALHSLALLPEAKAIVRPRLQEIASQAPFLPVFETWRLIFILAWMALDEEPRGGPEPQPEDGEAPMP